MFSWVLVRASEHEALARAEAPPGFLSPPEEAKLAELAFPERRRKWLLGRWAAKRVLCDALEQGLGHRPEPATLTIGNEPSGAPFAEREGVGRLPWSLSISHREELALAVLVREPGRALGADLEMVVPRDPALVRDFFTTEEARRVARLSGREADLAVARIWSAKEAVMKALGVGLRIDTRRIVVGATRKLRDHEPLAGAWEGVEVTARPEGATELSPEVYWRDEGAHVITVALLR